MTAKEVAFAEFLAPRAGYSGGFAFALSDRTRLCIGCGSIQLIEFAINFGNAIERELELDPSLDSWDHRAWRHFLDTPLKTLMKRILKLLHNRRLGFAVRPARWRPFLTNDMDFDDKMLIHVVNRSPRYDVGARTDAILETPFP